MYILQYQPVASGLLPAGTSGALPGFSVRAAGRTKNGPEMFRNGPEALQMWFGARRRSTGSISEYSGPTPGGGVRGVRRGGVWYVRRLSCQGRSRRLEALLSGAFGTFGERAFGMFGGFLGGVVRDVWRLSGRGRSGADCSFGPFADGPDADRAASGCGYLISRSGCSRRKCSQLCDPLREAAFLPPPSPLTRSGPRTAWSGLEVV